MEKISFKSSIKFVSKPQFNKAITSYSSRQSVCHPWTLKESVLSNKAYTKDIYDCSVCGVTDGAKVLLMHICPTIEFVSLRRIEEFIKDKFDLTNKNLQGFILGAKPHSEVDISYEQFENFKDFFEKFKIPFSMLKGSNHANDLAYDSSKDEWIVSTEFMDNEEICNYVKTPDKLAENLFDEVKISELDEITW